MAKPSGALQEISPDRIKRNPDNPRLIFHEDEMNVLLESIREGGIRVPVSVYADNGRYTLIDGERRWICAKKLNLRSIPALVQPKPTRLENLLIMFNIHNVRVNWDLMPMALKLGEIKDMLEKEGREASPKTLAVLTGVRPVTVRRALDLLALPRKYQTMLLKEAEKPRGEQRITPDVFIEVHKSLHAVERHAPEVFRSVTKADYVDSMVTKYINGVVDNVVAYRDVSRIARAELAGVRREDAAPAIIRLVRDRHYSIKEAFEHTVQFALEQRELLTRVRGLVERLSTFGASARLDGETRAALEQLKSEISRVLGGGE